MKKIHLQLPLVFLVVPLFILTATPAEAATVGPTKIQLNANPGQTIEGQIFLKNDGTQSQIFYPSFETFREQNGSKTFSTTPSDLTSWFKLPSSVTLAGGESRSIPFSLTVPKKASPGGHYAVMWWSTASASQKSDKHVSIVTRAGILVYLQVSGDIKESGSLSLSGPNFLIGFPANFNVSFDNTGNVELTPQGTLDIKNIFGGLAASLPFNQGGVIILPQSSNEFSLSWKGDGGFYFGFYKVILNASYGHSNQSASQSHWLFLVSWNILYILLGIIILIFVFPWFLHRYNNWIIKKARAGSH